MMKIDESGVSGSPRPAPISCSSDLAIPACALFGARVRSVNCPHELAVPRTKRKRPRKTPDLQKKDGFFREVMDRLIENDVPAAGRTLNGINRFIVVAPFCLNSGQGANQ